jgi:hypothetical protein
VKRPTKFEHFRWIGDRRTQVAYDLDHLEDESVIAELLAAPSNDGLNGVPYTCFSPDTLAEARNRGYRPYRGDGSGVGGVED